jgi:putative flavoprotein involved in K+ transport
VLVKELTAAQLLGQGAWRRRLASAIGGVTERDAEQSRPCEDDVQQTSLAETFADLGHAKVGMRERYDTVVIGGGQAGLAMSAVLEQRGRDHSGGGSVNAGAPSAGSRCTSSFRTGHSNCRAIGTRATIRTVSRIGATSSALSRTLRPAGGCRCASRPRSPICAWTMTGSCCQSRTGRSTPVMSSSRPGHSRSRASRPWPRASRRPCCKPIRRDTGLQRICPAGVVLVVGSGASGCQIGDELVRAGRTVFLSLSRHRRVPRRFRGKDVYWWLEKMGRFAQTIDTFPGRQWPPSIVVTGVNGGYDVDVRAMVVEGGRVVGRVLRASGGRLATARNANEILDEADTAFVGFLTAAREFAAANPGLELDADQPIEPRPLLATVAESEFLDQRREKIAAIIWATGYDYDYGWLRAPVLDLQGRPVQQRGVSPAPGAVLPRSALDAHDQVRVALRSWQRR